MSRRLIRQAALAAIMLSLVGCERSEGKGEAGGEAALAARGNFGRVANENAEAAAAANAMSAVDKQSANGGTVGWADIDKMMAKSSADTRAAYEAWKKTVVALQAKQGK